MENFIHDLSLLHYYILEKFKLVPQNDIVHMLARFSSMLHWAIGWV